MFLVSVYIKNFILLRDEMFFRFDFRNGLVIFVMIC